MNKKDREAISDLLYKLLLVKSPDEDEEELVILFGCDVTTHQSMSIGGLPVKKTLISVYMLDVTMSLATGVAHVDTCSVIDAQKFLSTVKVVDSEEYAGQIEAVMPLITGELSSINQRISMLGGALTTLRMLSTTGGMSEDIGNLIIGNNQNGLAHIVFSTMTGDVAKLTADDVDRVGNVIMDVIMNNLNSDTTNMEAMKKLRAEIDFKVIEALPADLRANDIKVNMDAIINEINKYQDKNGESKEESEEDDDNSEQEN